MKPRSVRLLKPFGNPKSFKFSVNQDKISLGPRTFLINDIQACRRTYGIPQSWPVVRFIETGLFLWSTYEFMSLVIRFQILMLLDLPDDAQSTSVQQTIDLLNVFFLRTSTTDEQQLLLFIYLYVIFLSFSIFLSNLIFRARISITLKSGEKFEMSYLILLNQGKLVKLLKRTNRVLRKNRKVSKS